VARLFVLVEQTLLYLLLVAVVECTPLGQAHKVKSMDRLVDVQFGAVT